MLKLQEWLTETGRTQAELAKAMEVSQPTISDWINGNTRPSAANLIRLSQVTGLSIDGMLRESVSA